MDNTEKQIVELRNNAILYAKLKSEIDPMEKKCKSLNTSIKGLMEILKMDNVLLPDGSSVKYSVSTKESLDEEKLIRQLKHFAPDTECIKTKEYVDMDVLENEIYHGKLSDDAMIALDACREVKEIPKLTIEKPKKKKS